MKITCSSVSTIRCLKTLERVEYTSKLAFGRRQEKRKEIEIQTVIYTENQTTKKRRSSHTHGKRAKKEKHTDKTSIA